MYGKDENKEKEARNGSFSKYLFKYLKSCVNHAVIDGRVSYKEKRFYGIGARTPEMTRRNRDKITTRTTTTKTTTTATATANVATGRTTRRTRTTRRSLTDVSLRPLTQPTRGSCREWLLACLMGTFLSCTYSLFGGISVTRKKSPNVYKSCPKMISLEK